MDFNLKHHSTLIIGDFKAVLPAVLIAAEEIMGMKALANPDLWQAEFSLFTVLDARELKHRQASRSLSGSAKFLIIGVGSITTEAQNALLKVLEEPATNTHIVLIAKSERMFLSTVLSRCQVFYLEAVDGTASFGEEVTSFLKGSPTRRLELIGIWQKEDRLSKEGLAQFFDQLERKLPEQKRPAARPVIVQARKYLYDRAALPKMILEYAALALP